MTLPELLETIKLEGAAWAVADLEDDQRIEGRPRMAMRRSRTARVMAAKFGPVNIKERSGGFV